MSDTGRGEKAGLVERLETAADFAARSHFTGWVKLCREAAAEIARLTRGLAECRSELAAAAAERDAARAVLSEVEWQSVLSSDGDVIGWVCADPKCDREQTAGHAPGCRIAAALGGPVTAR